MRGSGSLCTHFVELYALGDVCHPSHEKIGLFIILTHGPCDTFKDK